MKIFGAYSRGWDQKSIALYARGEYGAGEFEYPFFDGLNYDTFESLVLRNSGNDWLRTNLRDAAITSLMEVLILIIRVLRPYLHISMTLIGGCII